MRHRKSGRRLNRTSSHRQAMFRNMAASLIEHELIKTTLPKAKELRRLVEPLITLAKRDSVHNRRLAFARTRNAATVAKLFTDLGPRYSQRPGGYTRILKCGHRFGDAAPMAYIELIDRPLESEDQRDDAQGPEQQALPSPSEPEQPMPQEAGPAEAPIEAAAAEEPPATPAPEDASAAGAATDAPEQGDASPPEAPAKEEAPPATEPDK